MKIAIREQKGRGFCLSLPLSIIKFRFIGKKIFEHMLDMDGKDVAEVKSILSAVYNALKKFKKQNGRFKLFSAISAGGDKVEVWI